MTKKKIDLTPFVQDQDDNLVRNIFYNDFDLKLLFLSLNNHEPISLPQLTQQFNSTFHKNFPKGWVVSKLKKIENFGLIERKSFSDCKKNSSGMEHQIIQNHSKWLLDSDIPAQFQKIYNNVKYYYLTEQGQHWVDIVSEQLGRNKNGF